MRLNAAAALSWVTVQHRCHSVQSLNYNQTFFELIVCMYLAMPNSVVLLGDSTFNCPACTRA